MKLPRSLLRGSSFMLGLYSTRIADDAIGRLPTGRKEFVTNAAVLPEEVPDQATLAAVLRY